MAAELPEGRVLFRWTPTEADRVTLYDQIAKEYAIIENPTAANGIVVYARWSDGWEANPWSERALLRHLLQRLAEAEKGT